MTSKGNSVVVMLIAFLIVASGLAAFYYYQTSQETQAKDRYVNELNGANGKYDQLVSNYSSSLSLFNKTFALLVSAISSSNTSSPAYQQASGELSQLWSSYLRLGPAKSLYTASVLFDFGNGTRHWYNETKVQPGWSLYVTSVVLTNGDLRATWYPQYREHLINGIDGIQNTQSASWFAWTYNRTASWQTAQVGADDIPVYAGSVLAWTYCGMTPAFEPTCKP